MANQVDRRTLVKWLLDHNFEEKAVKRGGHRQFAGKAVTITVLGHGPTDITKKHIGSILRMLANAGFDKEVTRRELETGSW